MFKTIHIHIFVTVEKFYKKTKTNKELLQLTRESDYSMIVCAIELYCYSKLIKTHQ